MPRTKPWTVSDEFWERVEPLIPPAPSHAKGGRPRMPDRQAFEAMVYVLRTGIQWNALPKEMGASSTVHERFQEWERAGFFERLWEAELAEYDELEGIEWEWQSVDGVMTKKAPLGRADSEARGPNPTDRAKMGVKRSVLTDGSGIPLAMAVDGANRPDSKLLVATLDGIVVARPVAEDEDCCEQSTYVWTPATTPKSYARRSRREATRRTSVLGTGDTRARSAIQAGRRAAGWWSGRTRGSTAPGVYWCAGRRRPRTIWHSCILPAPNSSSPNYRFPDKDLGCSR